MQSKRKKSDFEIEEESIVHYNGSKPRIPRLELDQNNTKFNNEKKDHYK